MIVEVGFLDHWKTQALIQATGEATAPLMVLRLWEHCQMRRTYCFIGMSDVALAAICRWSKSPAQLRVILVECGFISSDDQNIIVHDWEKTNRSLIASWNNGLKGGRPKTSKRKTHGLPMGYPRGTQPSNNKQIILPSEVCSSGTRLNRCTLEESVSYCAERGLTKEDGQWFWNKCEGCGWKNNGKAIINWKRTVIAWQLIRIFPSQKQKGNTRKPWQQRPPDPRDEQREREMRKSHDQIKKFYADKGIKL